MDLSDSSGSGSLFLRKIVWVHGAGWGRGRGNTRGGSLYGLAVETGVGSSGAIPLATPGPLGHLSAACLPSPPLVSCLQAEETAGIETHCRFHCEAGWEVALWFNWHGEEP